MSQGIIYDVWSVLKVLKKPLLKEAFVYLTSSLTKFGRANLARW